MRVVLQSQPEGSTIKIVTSYDPDDADATLENEIEVE